jgi:hypothetical protein
LFGHVYNPFAGSVGRAALKDIVEAVQIGWAPFIDAVSELSGRFVLFVEEKNGELIVVPDATASLPVSYLIRDGIFASSHPRLLGRTLGLSEDAEVNALLRYRYFKIGMRHLAGDRTEVEQVRFLTPNLVLTYNGRTSRVARIFPNTSRKECRAEAIAGPASDVLASSVRCLRELGHPVTCALSGGLDSRVTLAASRGNLQHVLFFTHGGSRNAARDLATVRKLAADLPIKWEPLASKNIPIALDEFREEYEAIATLRSPRIRSSVETNLAAWGRTQNIEMRSTISGVGRSFFRRKFLLTGTIPLSSRLLVPMYKRIPPRSTWASTLELWFADWMERSQFREVTNSGYDWLDLLMWEHRDGTWNSRQFQTLDWYCCPTSIFNNRKLLSMLLSAPASARSSDTLHRMIVRELWPDALNEPMVKNFGLFRQARRIAEGAYVRAYMLFRRLETGRGIAAVLATCAGCA